MKTDILKSSAKFSFGGHPSVEGYPLFLGRDGRIVEELTVYFRKRFALQNGNCGTLMDEAYILREWWDYLVDEGLDFSSVSESSFLIWVRKNQLKMDNARVQRKIDVIHRFQQFSLRKAYGVEFPLGIFSGKEPQFRFPLSDLYSRTTRPTPDFRDVESVLEFLAARSSDLLATRDYLMARWMADTGLRRQGVAQLNICRLVDALEREAIDVGPSSEFSSMPLASQDWLLGEFERLRMANRRHLYVEVTEKRNKTRYIQAPIDLVIETIEYVWGERRKFEQELKREGRALTSEDGLWVSLKTKEALSPGAIGDIIKAAFNATGIRGSGHRLRAHYACSLVLRLYRHQKLLHGEGWDAPAVLLQAAELLGHSRIESLRPYLNRAIREDAFGAS